MECSETFLKDLCDGKEFVWHYKPPQGRSDGMLLGNNLQTFDIDEIGEGGFFIKFKIRNRETYFKWLSVSVHGAAQQELKEEFLSELSLLCAKGTLPVILIS
jgi:hypothetical protein